MPYNLAQVAKEQKKRSRSAVRVRIRNAPRQHERDLMAILRGVINDPDNPVALTTAVQRSLGWLHGLATWNLRQWERNTLSQLGVDLRGLATTMDHDPEVQKALDWLIALIQDLQVQTAARISTFRAAAVAQGLTKAETAAGLSLVIKKQVERARLIAHDQTQKIAAKINERQQAEAGVTRYKWNHSFLPNARRHHIERQGNVYLWSRPPRGGHPGTEINCRCTASALIET